MQGGPGSIPGQETRSYILQLRFLMLQLKISHAETKKKKKKSHVPQLKDPTHCNEGQGSHMPPLGPNAVKSIHTYLTLSP